MTKSDSSKMSDNLIRATTRLKEIRESAGLNQREFAKMFKVNHTTYNRYESGGIGKMPNSLIENICDHFGINYAWILGYEGVEKYMLLDKSYAPIKRIPVIGTIAAGTPVLAQEDLLGYEYITEEDSVSFCLRIKGDSMINARIFDGDLVFVRQQPDVENGDIAVVLIDDNEATLKRIFKVNGNIILHPENPKYKDVVITKKDLKQVKIIGKVTAVKFYVE